MNIKVITTAFVKLTNNQCTNARDRHHKHSLMSMAASKLSGNKTQQQQQQRTIQKKGEKTGERKKERKKERDMIVLGARERGY